MDRDKRLSELEAEIKLKEDKIDRLNADILVLETEFNNTVMDLENELNQVDEELMSILDEYDELVAQEGKVVDGQMELNLNG